MGSIREGEHDRLLLIRVSEQEIEMLRKLGKERKMSISELIKEALDFIDGDPHVC